MAAASPSAVLHDNSRR